MDPEETAAPKTAAVPAPAKAPTINSGSPAQTATTPPGDTSAAAPVAPAAAERPELPLASSVLIEPVDDGWSKEKRLEQAVQRMRKIALAISEHSAKEGRFPAAPGSKLSWRVQLLPYLGHADALRKFNFSQPWDSPANIAAAASIPPVYQSPFAPNDQTVFLAPLASTSLFGDADGVSVAKLGDSWSQTISLLMVDPANAVPWAKPADYDLPDSGLVASLTRSQGGCLVAFADSEVRWLSPKTGDHQALGMFTITGGEKLNVATDVQATTEALAPLAKLIQAAGSTAGSDSSDTLPLVNGTLFPEIEGAMEPFVDSASPAIATLPRGSGSVKSDRRLPVPDETEVSKAKAHLRQVFQEEIENTKRGDTKRFKHELADELMKSSKKVEGDSAAYYVLLQTARDNAAASGDFKLAQQATQELIARYAVNDFELRRCTAIESGKELIPHYEKQNDELCKYAEQVLREAILRDEFDAAEQLLEVFMESTRRKTSDKPMNKSPNKTLRTQDRPRDRPTDKEKEELQRMQTAEKELADMKKAYQPIPAARQVLEQSPDDPEANYTVGEYVCCVKMQWDQGLLHLAKGSNLRLKVLATEDLATSDLSPTVADLANEYWSLGEQETGLQMRGLQMRAVYWYTRILPKLPNGLNKVLAQRRIDEAKKKHGEPLVKEALGIMSPELAKTYPVSGD